MVKKTIGVAAGLSGFIFSSVAFAQVTLANPLAATDLNGVLANVNVFLLMIAAPLCGIMVVWGGFQMMTAGGNPEKFSEGRKTLLYAAIGFAVVIFASSVTPLIKSIFGAS